MNSIAASANSADDDRVLDDVREALGDPIDPPRVDRQDDERVDDAEGEGSAAAIRISAVAAGGSRPYAASPAATV